MGLCQSQPPMVRRPAASTRAAAIALDLLLFALILIWLRGGVSWHGRHLLRYGPDLRRAALISGGLAAWLAPSLRNVSLGLRAASGVWRALDSRRIRWNALAVTALIACILGVLQALAL